MKIIVDAMSGDNAPFEIVKGAVMAVTDSGADIILVGKGEEILRCIEKLGMKNIPKGIEIAHTSEIITMEDVPSAVIKEKKDSSMTVALNMLSDGRGEALVSAGNTGALLTGSTLIVKRIRGIRRAALSPVLPEDFGNSIIIDVGANTECTSEYLVQFAYMGASYARNVLDKGNPKIALLNIGTEETKGQPLHRETFKLLKEASSGGMFDFIGNMEGRDILYNKADVIVCDGFSGNILLKTIEGTALYMAEELKGIFTKNIWSKLAAGIVKKDILKLKKRLDYTEVGGSVLIGISKPVIKAHGSSDANAIKNAIGQAIKIARSRFVEEIVESIDNIKAMVENSEKNS